MKKFTTEETLIEQSGFRLRATYECVSSQWRHEMAGRFDKPSEKFTPDVVSVITHRTLTGLSLDDYDGRSYSSIDKFSADKLCIAVEKFRSLINDSAA